MIKGHSNKFEQIRIFRPTICIFPLSNSWIFWRSDARGLNLLYNRKLMSPFFLFSFYNTQIQLTCMKLIMVWLCYISFNSFFSLIQIPSSGLLHFPHTLFRRKSTEIPFVNNYVSVE